MNACRRRERLRPVTLCRRLPGDKGRQQQESPRVARAARAACMSSHGLLVSSLCFAATVLAPPEAAAAASIAASKRERSVTRSSIVEGEQACEGARVTTITH